MTISEPFRPSRFFMSFYLSYRCCCLRLFLERDGVMLFRPKCGDPSIALGGKFGVRDGHSRQ